MTEGAETLNFIVHKGDEKDPGPDLSLKLGEMGREVWLVSGDSTLYTEQPSAEEVTASVGNLSQAEAHWLREDTLALDTSGLPQGAQYSLVYAADAGLSAKNLSGEVFPLTLDESGLGEEVREDFPHLAELGRLELADPSSAPDLLRGQLAVVARDQGGTLLRATGVQIPGVLDDLYAEAAYDEPLGVVWEGERPTVRVWAPTTQDMRLHLFESPDGEAEVQEMTFDDATGIWSVTGRR